MRIVINVQIVKKMDILLQISVMYKFVKNKNKKNNKIKIYNKL